MLRQKQIAVDQEEHIKRVKITQANYEVEIKIEESKFEWLRQDWGEASKNDKNQKKIMDNMRAQLEAAQKARAEAEDLKHQEWERAKVML